MLCQMFKKKICQIVLAAPTGISAAGINGMTLHSALSLPIEHHATDTGIYEVCQLHIDR